MEIKEGYMPFMGYQTYYRIVGKQRRARALSSSCMVDQAVPTTISSYWIG